MEVMRRGRDEARSFQPTLEKTIMKRLTVLCVEHRSEYRQQMRLVLERAGYDVVCACSGREALVEFSSRGLDGVFLEHDLPDISGRRLRDEMLRVNPKLPVILITGGERQLRFLLRFFATFAVDREACKEPTQEWVHMDPAHH